MKKIKIGERLYIQPFTHTALRLLVAPLMDKNSTVHDAMHLATDLALANLHLLQRHIRSAQFFAERHKLSLREVLTEQISMQIGTVARTKRRSE